MKANNWFKVEQLADGLFGIGEFGHFEEVISFLLLGQQQALLIDSGMGLFSMKEAVESITKLPCAVLNTHSHFDHVGSNHEFEEVALFDHVANRRVAREGYSAEYLDQWVSDEQFWGKPPSEFVRPYQIPAFPQATFFGDNVLITKGEFKLRVIHTPGHSDDSVCFFEETRGWLFVGDLLYNGPIYVEGDGGLGKFRKSLHRLDQIVGLNRIFSAHNYYEFSKSQFVKVKEAAGQISGGEIESEVLIEGRLRLVPY